MGADYCITEMISSEALVRRVSRTLHMLKGIELEPDTFVQIMGSRPGCMAEAARIAEGLGAPGIDINMGCPERRIVAQGAGAALLRDEGLALRIVEEVIKAVNVPVTVKTRIGWSLDDVPRMNAFLKALEGLGVKMFAIHARTRTQMFRGEPDWKALSEITQGLKVPVMANGSITDYCSLKKAMAATSSSGAMIGRGALGAPWIFKYILKGDARPLEDKAVLVKEHRDAVIEHARGILEFYGETKGILPLRRHLTWYSKGLRGGATFRKKVMNCTSGSEILKAFEAFV